MITPEITSALDRYKVSTRNAMHIVAATIKSISNANDLKNSFEPENFKKSTVEKSIHNKVMKLKNHLHLTVF